MYDSDRLPDPSCGGFPALRLVWHFEPTPDGTSGSDKQLVSRSKKPRISRLKDPDPPLDYWEDEAEELLDEL